MSKFSFALTRLPLPMLALAASYGVWSFNLMFVPHWVALVSAAAFELTYVALALTQTADKRRAMVIAVSAVIVSVLYNSLAGLFHIRPELLVARPLWADVTLAVLHGAPLAIVAYNVAVLLLHSGVSASAVRHEVDAPEVRPTQQADELEIIRVNGRGEFSVRGLAGVIGMNEATLRRRFDAHSLRAQQVQAGD